MTTFGELSRQFIGVLSSGPHSEPYNIVRALFKKSVSDSLSQTAIGPGYEDDTRAHEVGAQCNDSTAQFNSFIAVKCLGRVRQISAALKGWIHSSRRATPSEQGRRMPSPRRGQPDCASSLLAPIGRNALFPARFRGRCPSATMDQAFGLVSWHTHRTEVSHLLGGTSEMSRMPSSFKQMRRPC